MEKTREKLAVGLYLALSLFVPLGVVELYPFSSPSMFAHHPSSYTVYELQNPLGESLNPHSFGIGFNQPHDPPVRTLGRHGYGRNFPPSPAGYNKTWDETLLKRRVIEQLKRRGMAFATVTGRRFEVSGGEVVCSETKEWVVKNPNFYR